MYIPQAIIKDVIREIGVFGEATVCTEEVADYFATMGYQVNESNVGFRHWWIKEV